MLGPPRSRAARRIVGIPASIVPALREHLSLFVGLEADGLIFAGVKGGPLRRSNFNKLEACPHAVHAIGAAGLHFHDLRHTGNHFAAASGASLKDLMARMGHDSERAAIKYQHEARGADLAITSTIDAHIETAKASRGQPADGKPRVQLKSGNGPWRSTRRQQAREPCPACPLNWAFTSERVTRIELALSAWESDRSGPLTILTWAVSAPLVTVMNPATPGVMARQWPVA